MKELAILFLFLAAGSADSECLVYPTALLILGALCLILSEDEDFERYFDETLDELEEDED